MNAPDDARRGWRVLPNDGKLVQMVDYYSEVSHSTAGRNILLRDGMLNRRSDSRSVNVRIDGMCSKLTSNEYNKRGVSGERKTAAAVSE